MKTFYLTCEDDIDPIRNELIFPVELSAAYVPNGWHRTANTLEEFRTLLDEGLRLSPISEVEVKCVTSIS